MLSLQDGIKYVGIAAIVYFLIKAFAGDKLMNTHIFILVILIMAIVIFIMNQKTNCPKKERFQVTDPPLVDSIYPGPPNIDEPLDSPEKPKPHIKEKNLDIQDFKDIMGINKQTYQKLIENEKRAENKIRAKYQNEMVYTSTHPFNTIPLGTQLYGYTYLPPENWFRAYERPPVCITDKRCPVCPVADATTSELMEFDTTDNVLGPEGINLRYVKKILNGNMN